MGERVELSAADVTNYAMPMHMAGMRNHDIALHRPGGAEMIVSMLERIVRDPTADIDKIERLFPILREMQEKAARTAYDAAMAEMQPELPTIDKNGKIEIRDKATGNVTQSTPFAEWADINEAIRPILGKHGFSLSFKNGRDDKGHITVKCICSHRDGHREETEMVFPHDSSGSKNAVQAIGSSTQYGKRYTGCSILNITSRARPERDDDGTAACKPATISVGQMSELSQLAEERKANIPAFLKYLGQLEKSTFAELSDIPATVFDTAVKILKQKVAA